MRRIREATFEEFVHWYLTRERRKRNRPKADARPTTLAEMRRTHPDKLRPWFDRGRWSVVSLEALDEALGLVCVDGPETRRWRLVADSGPDNRLMRTVIAAACTTGYFEDLEVRRTNSVEAHFRHERIESYRRQWPSLREDERLVVCTVNSDERAANPGANYYLHDGFGRLLPYLYLVTYESRAWRPIEAYLAEEL